MSETTTTAVAVPEKKAGWLGLLAQHEQRIAPFLPAGVGLDRVASTLWMAAEQNPDLKKCSPQSLILGTARILSWGLELGTTAHLIPFGGSATATPDYKGYIQLMREAGARDVDAQVVREGDEYESALGTHPYIRHVKKAKQGAPIVKAYCIVWITSFRFKLEEMTAEEIDAIRQEKSRSWKKGPLPEWYARKTVIRRAAKYLPRPSEKLTRALVADEVDNEQALAPTPDALPAAQPSRRLGSGTLPSDYDDTRPAFAGREPVRVVQGTPTPAPSLDALGVPEHERDPYGLEDTNA